jgi:hypothetical protein
MRSAFAAIATGFEHRNDHQASLGKIPRANRAEGGGYRAQTFLRKLDAQAWSSELERSIDCDSSAGVI